MTENTGTKYDEEKIMMDLLEPEPLLGIAEVFTYGAKKYGRNNYKGGIEHWRLYGAMLRHLTAWHSVEPIDKESGLPHLYHAGCCLFMLIWMEAHRPDLGHRIVPYVKPKEDKNVFDWAKIYVDEAQAAEAEAATKELMKHITPRAAHHDGEGKYQRDQATKIAELERRARERGDTVKVAVTFADAVEDAKPLEDSATDK